MLRAAWRFVVCLLAGLGLLLILVTFTPLVNGWSRLLAGPWTDPKGDVLIVLGGDVIDGGILGEFSYWRAVYSIRCWREGVFQQIVLSGGAPITIPMKRFLVSEGVPDAAIRIESTSSSTRENALFTSRLLQDNPPRNPVLLTSDYHMFRAWRAFRKAGLTTSPRPIPDALKRGQTWWRRWSVFLDLLLESGKIIYYETRGWL